MFSDQLMPLYDLINPIQKKMIGRPLLIFIQACRGRFNMQYVDQYTESDSVQQFHPMKDTFIFYSTPCGSLSFRPLEPDQPSNFIRILAEHLVTFGSSEDMQSIACRVVEEVSRLPPVEVVHNHIRHTP